MSKEYPTPWTYDAEDVWEDSPIRAANGEYVLVRDNGVYPPDLETCREIVEAVNERDRLRDLVRRIETEMERCHRRDGEISQELMDAVYEAHAIGEDKQ